MKKALSLILALVLCLSLCACGNNESKIKDALINGVWASDETTDDGTVRTYDYKIVFYSDGTVKKTHIHHTYNWPWKLDPEEETSTGTWSIDGSNVILTFGNDAPKSFSFSYDEGESKNTLVGPQAEGGFTYYSYIG